MRLLQAKPDEAVPGSLEAENLFITSVLAVTAEHPMERTIFALAWGAREITGKLSGQGYLTVRAALICMLILISAHVRLTVVSWSISPLQLVFFL